MTPWDAANQGEGSLGCAGIPQGEACMGAAGPLFCTAGRTLSVGAGRLVEEGSGTAPHGDCVGTAGEPEF